MTPSHCDCGAELDELGGACACALDGPAGKGRGQFNRGTRFTGGGMRALSERKYGPRSPAERVLSNLGGTGRVQLALLDLAAGRPSLPVATRNAARYGLVAFADPATEKAPHLTALGIECVAILNMRKDAATAQGKGVAVG